MFLQTDSYSACCHNQEYRILIENNNQTLSSSPYFPTELLSFVADIADHFGDSVYFKAIGSASSLFSGQIMKIRTVSSL